MDAPMVQVTIEEGHEEIRIDAFILGSPVKTNGKISYVEVETATGRNTLVAIDKVEALNDEAKRVLGLQGLLEEST